MPDLDVNLVLNLLMFGTLVIFGPRALRAAQWKAQLHAKDGVIATNEQTIRSMTERMGELERTVTELRAQREEDRALLVAVERDLTTWRTRYEEMQRFAAPEALEAVSRQIAEAVTEGSEKWEARWEGVEGVLREVKARLDRVDAERELDRTQAEVGQRRADDGGHEAP